MSIEYVHKPENPDKSLKGQERKLISSETIRPLCRHAKKFQFDYSVSFSTAVRCCITHQSDILCKASHQVLFCFLKA